MTSELLLPSSQTRASLQYLKSEIPRILSLYVREMDDTKAFSVIS